MARESEIADVGVFALGPFRHQDVSRLHVAVDESRLVCHVERLCDLRDQIESTLWLEPPFTPEHLAEVRTLHVDHREVERSLFLAGRDDRDDVGMVQARRELGLAKKTSTEPFVPRQLRR